jgi:hypothetical protein
MKQFMQAIVLCPFQRTYLRKIEFIRSEDKYIFHNAMVIHANPNVSPVRLEKTNLRLLLIIFAILAKHKV